MTVLVTGGAGFIGTHTLVELHKAGLDYIVVDNLSNSSARSLEAVSQITGTEVPFIRGDITDSRVLSDVIDCVTSQGRAVSAAIHFAALKSVAESFNDPLNYYENNVLGTIRLLQCLTRAGVKNCIFSSSATVYGEPRQLPFNEAHAIAPTNPYGQTKAMAESILANWAGPHSDNKVLSLRYFNPIGAHSSGIIGEDPRGTPNNLFPYIARVAQGKLGHLSVFGNDYDTTDGTGVRDYVHVVDIARAHVRAVSYLSNPHAMGFLAMNLGTGKGTSVMQLVDSFERASKVKIPVRFVARRPGDVASMWADVSMAEKVLGWKAELSLAAMCEDGWRWQSRNPDGFEGQMS